MFQELSFGLGLHRAMVHDVFSSLAVSIRRTLWDPPMTALISHKTSVHGYRPFVAIFPDSYCTTGHSVPRNPLISDTEDGGRYCPDMVRHGEG